MRYYIRAADHKFECFVLLDLKDNDRIAYRGPFQWARAMSVLLNLEDMRLHGELGGSVPPIDKLWPRDWRSPDKPMPREH